MHAGLHADSLHVLSFAFAASKSKQPSIYLAVTDVVVNRHALPTSSLKDSAGVGVSTSVLHLLFG